MPSLLSQIRNSGLYEVIDRPANDNVVSISDGGIWRNPLRDDADKLEAQTITQEEVITSLEEVLFAHAINHFEDAGDLEKEAISADAESAFHTKFYPLFFASENYFGLITVNQHPVSSANVQDIISYIFIKRTDEIKIGNRFGYDVEKTIPFIERKDYTARYKIKIFSGDKTTVYDVEIDYATVDAVPRVQYTVERAQIKYIPAISLQVAHRTRQLYNATQHNKPNYNATHLKFDEASSGASNAFSPRPYSRVEFVTSQIILPGSNIDLADGNSFTVNVHQTVESEIVLPDIYVNNIVDRNGVNVLSLDRLVKATVLDQNVGVNEVYTISVSPQEYNIKLTARPSAVENQGPSIDPTYKTNFVPLTLDSIVIPTFSSLTQKKSPEAERDGKIDSDRTENPYGMQPQSLDEAIYFRGKKVVTPEKRVTELHSPVSDLDRILEVRNGKPGNTNTGEYTDISTLVKKVEYVDGLIVKNGSVIVNENLTHEKIAQLGTEDLTLDIYDENNHTQTTKTFDGKSIFAMAYKLLADSGYKDELVVVYETAQDCIADSVVDSDFSGYMIKLKGATENQGLTIWVNNREPEMTDRAVNPTHKSYEQGSNLKVILGDYGGMGHLVEVDMNGSKMLYDDGKKKVSQCGAEIVIKERLIVPEHLDGATIADVLRYFNQDYDVRNGKLLNSPLRREAQALGDNMKPFVAYNRSKLESLNETVNKGMEIQAGYIGTITQPNLNNKI